MAAGSVYSRCLFHWGILVVFLGHLLAFLFPGWTLSWHGARAAGRRWIVIFTFGLAVLVGFVGLIIRRISRPRIRVVTSRMDVAIELLLLGQIIFGLWIALGYRWGYYWFASDMSPYLRSIVTFAPQIDAVSAMPWVIKTLSSGPSLWRSFLLPVHFWWRHSTTAALSGHLTGTKADP
jgi:nitrate reductase gamma subunit